MSAAVAFYTILSLAPLLLIAIAIAGLAFGEEAARGELYSEIRKLVGEDGARAVETMIANSRRPELGSTAAVLGTLMIAVGATGAVAEIRDAINNIWGVETPFSQGWLGIVRGRLLALALVIGIGILLFASLVWSAVLADVVDKLPGPTSKFPSMLRVADFAASFTITMFLFALIFRVLPDVTLPWTDVLAGAALTSALFTLGRYLIGEYLARAGVGSAYGAAGSLVIVILWVYYAAQILFLGAELTGAIARRRHPHLLATLDVAKSTSPNDREPANE
jgi:membrane protein